MYMYIYIYIHMHYLCSSENSCCVSRKCERWLVCICTS